ncbi:cytochrome P450 [Stachybotrys elegans]|uniref:Cytochrome P450 n=1 Tax=Stachybotrys elegans TaxID=80388 RepID=A0A8K0WKM1_9HYPO|nr:cytochrome P450 [Stachybotrys elegans]
MLQLSILATAVMLLATYFYNRLWHIRFKQYAHFPQLPPSLLLGHLKAFDDITKKGGPPDRHPDKIFAEMSDSIGSPPLMLVDLRPVNQPMVLVGTHDIAEQISRASDLLPTSAPKSPLGYMMPLIGTKSIVAAEGDDWKNLRKRFNPGFAPQHLKTLIPTMLEKLPTFVGNIEALAKSGENFKLTALLMSLTFDIIGAVVMDVDLEAQSGKGELIQLYQKLLSCYDDDKADLPWWIIPRITMERHRLGKKIDELVREIVRRKHADQNKRSILSLSLGDSETLTPEIVATTSDQIKSFLFAGHDTISTTLAWALYELSRTPKAAAAVHEELDNLFGPDSTPAEVSNRLMASDGPEMIRRMTYISAVIKETLRLHAPAGTSRTSKPGTGLVVRTAAGEEYCLDGLFIYNCAPRIHRDRSVYGDTADDFIPERWLHADDSNGKSHSLPAGAWRPFERGPRNCIGQEFALIEARIVIATVARRYKFVKVGLGEIHLDHMGQPVLQANGQYKTNSKVYQTRQITAKPVDGMQMRVEIRSEN